MRTESRVLAGKKMLALRLIGPGLTEGGRRFGNITYNGMRESIVRTATATENPGKDHPLVLSVRFPPRPSTIREKSNKTPAAPICEQRF